MDYAQQSPSNQTVLHDEESSQPLFLKVIIGIVVVIVIIALVFFIIIPLFFSKKDADVTIKYWGIWEDEATMKTIIADYEREHPHIHITYEKQDIKTLGNYLERVVTRSQNGNGPDIFRFHNSWIYRLRNYLLPLPSDVVSKLELDTKYYPVFKNDLKSNGAYYGAPLMIDTLSLFINQDIFKASGIPAPPQTWNDFVDTARKLTVPDPQTGKITTYGAAIGTYDNIDHASDILSLLFVQNGADMYDLGGRLKKNADDALDFYTCFAISRPPDCVRVWDDTADNAKLAFAKGNVAMYFGYSWDVLDFKKANPNLNFTVVAVPHLAGTSATSVFRNSTIASYWAEGISSKTKHPKESFDFLAYLAQKDTLEKLFTTQSKVRLFGELYPRSDMRSMLSSNQLIYPFVAQADSASATIFASDTFDMSVSSVMNGYIGNAIRSVHAGTSPASAVEALGSGVTQTISKYGQ